MKTLMDGSSDGRDGHRAADPPSSRGTPSFSIMSQIPRPDAQQDPPPGQRGQRRDRARQHGRGTAGQVGDRHQAGDPFGLAEEERDQRVRVQLGAEIRMVGDGEQVQAVAVRLGDEIDRLGRRGGIRTIPRAQPDAEQDIAIRHW